jgi:hypothetical protein
MNNTPNTARAYAFVNSVPLAPIPNALCAWFGQRVCEDSNGGVFKFFYKLPGVFVHATTELTPSALAGIAGALVGHIATLTFANRCGEVVVASKQELLSTDLAGHATRAIEGEEPCVWLDDVPMVGMSCRLSTGSSRRRAITPPRYHDDK